MEVTARYGLGRTIRGALASTASAVFVLIGRFDEARSLAEDAVCGTSGNFHIWALATISLEEGDEPAVDQLLTQLDSKVTDTTEPQFVEPVYAIRAERALMAGDPKQARSIVAQGLDRLSAAAGQLTRPPACAGWESELKPIARTA